MSLNRCLGTYNKQKSNAFGTSGHLQKHTIYRDKMTFASLRELPAGQSAIPPAKPGNKRDADFTVPNFNSFLFFTPSNEINHLLI